MCRRWIRGAGQSSTRPRGRTARPAIAVSIDVLDEDHSLTLALKRLTADRALRQQLGAAAEIYWRANHTVAQMVADYEVVLPRAARRNPPAVRSSRRTCDRMDWNTRERCSRNSATP